MITMQEMEKELAIYRKNFTAVRLISEADILRTIEARKHNPASRACPCRDGRMTSQGCRNCIVLRAYMEKCKKIKLEYDDPNVYQVTARYLHVEGGRYVLELVQKLDDDMMIDAESGEKLANRLSSYEDKLYHDALTGTLNRRYYEEHMCKTVYEAGIAMIDVDNFKLYNDVFGHRAGDVVLETMAQSVKLHTASGDLLVRLGGDEFLLVMPGIPADRLYSRLLQVSEAVHNTPVPGYTNLQISISIGGVMGNGRLLETAVEQADQLMYQAKTHTNMVMTEMMLAQSSEQENELHARKERILIVDDSELNRALLTEMLEDDYEILEAANGQECMDILNAGSDKISLMLLDLLMPVMDGFEVLASMNRSHMLENLPVIMISSEDSDAFIRRAYEQGVSDYISRPFDAKVVHRRVYNTIKLYAKQRRLVSMVTSQILEKEKNNMLLINILSHVVEFRNGQNVSHVQHMRQLSERLLETLCAKTDRYRLTPQDCDLIALASSMHDIGKIAIDAKILNKPGKLTPEEFEQMKQHTILGAKMLDDLAAHHNEKLVGTACDICRWHHERYDGHGYPDGLVGDEIPISAQVVSLADVYDALISERVYKPAYSHEQAMAMILNGECGVFNPLLIECLKELRETLRCELDVPLLNVKREKAPGDGAKPAESKA